MKQIKIGKNKYIKGYSTEEVFRKSMKSEAYRKVYHEEIARLRIVRQLRETRINKKLTQKGVALKANVPQSVVARIENGRQSFSFRTLHKLATALNKEVKLV
ncbi:MAG TPA: helix-turn-helix transcriptional regulator [Candidatus Paceibacterota bacterium]|nr:helix-turn-helix transcriptional regulator [Candidatus Paceibacterota bacterium]